MGCHRAVFWTSAKKSAAAPAPAILAVIVFISIITVIIVTIIIRMIIIVVLVIIIMTVIIVFVFLAASPPAELRTPCVAWSFILAAGCCLHCAAVKELHLSYHNPEATLFARLSLSW